MNRNTIFVVSGIIVLTGGTIGYRSLRNANGSSYELAAVQKGTLVQEVSASGKVESPTKVDLHFKNSGKLVALKAKVGDAVTADRLLAKQDTGVLDAQWAEMQAGIDVQKARLEQLRAGASPEDIAVAETAVTNAETSVDDARRSFVDTLQDAYTKADDAVRGKADQSFSSSQANNPQLTFWTGDSNLENDIEWSRLLIESNIFRVWKPQLAAITAASDVLEYAGTTRGYLTDIKTFLDKLALAINNPNASYMVSGTAQAMPSGWRSDISAARTNINAAFSALSSAEEKLRTEEANLKTARDQLTLKKAPARSSDVALYEAQIRQAEAQMQKIGAQIREMIITAPADGVVTDTDGAVGEIVAPDAAVVSLMPRGNLQVNVDVSEADVADVRVGQEASVTLDAFGDDVEWRGKVASVDPAETIVSGAVYYTATVLFDQEDERVRSGMTANVRITTARKEGALYIPVSAVKEKRGGEPIDSRLYPYVEVSEGGQTKEKEVRTGIKGEGGVIEIVSGLSEGEQIILPTSPR